MHAWPHNALARPHFVYLTRSVDGNHYWTKVAFLKFPSSERNLFRQFVIMCAGQWAIGLLHDFLARAAAASKQATDQATQVNATATNATAVRIIRMKLTTWQLSIEFG